MQHIINQLILIAGAWNTTKEKQLECQFDFYLTKLQTVSGLSREGAINLLLKG